MIGGPRLPLLDRLEGVKQHDDVQRQIVANVQRQTISNANASATVAATGSFFASRKPRDHGEIVGDRIDDGVAEIIQRDVPAR